MDNPVVKVKTFVLDTNVPLYDPFCLNNFQENNVIIPIVVFQEMDRFKKGNESKNINAREFSRIVDALSEAKIFNGGVSLGDGRGTLRISLGVEYPEVMSKSFMDINPDNLIIATALTLKAKGENVVLVSNDTNVVLKSRALGIIAENYKNDEVKDINRLYDNIEQLKLSPAQEAKLYAKGDTNILGIKSIVNKYKTNQLIKIDSLRLARKTDEGIKFIEKSIHAAGIYPRNDEQFFALDALFDDNISLVALTGNAGTGKTLLALAAGYYQQQNSVFEKVVVARPPVELSNKTMGFLPGGKEEKIAPYMQPVFDNLELIRTASVLAPKKPKSQNQKKLTKEVAATSDEGRRMPIEEWAKGENIDILVLSFVRGITLTKRFFIIDEAQNLTPHETRTIITRAGEDTKIIFCGDITQIDDPYLDERSNGLSYLIDKWKGETEFVHVHLEKGERSPLAEKAARIMK